MGIVKDTFSKSCYSGQFGFEATELWDEVSKQSDT